MKQNKPYWFFYRTFLNTSMRKKMSVNQLRGLAKRYSALLTGLGKGLTVREAALKKGINPRTAESTMILMRKTLGAKNIHHLVAIAIRTKLIK